MRQKDNKKFELGKVMSDALEMYSEHRGLLLKLSLYSVSIAIISTILSKLVSYYHGTGSIAVIILSFVVSWVVFYYSLKFDISMMIAVSELRNMEESSIKDYYTRAKEFVWPVIGISILIGFIILIPMLMIMAGSTGFIEPIGRTILWGLGSILLILALVKFQFATISRIFSPKESDWFAASNRLVKGNFFKAMILGIIIYSVPLITSALGSYVERLGYTSITITLGILIEFVALLLFKPYQISLQVLAYHELKVNHDEENVLDEM